MAVFLTPDDQPQMGRCGAAERHRRRARIHLRLRYLPLDGGPYCFGCGEGSLAGRWSRRQAVAGEVGSGRGVV